MVNETQYLNEYHCTACGVSWDDVWSCGCDDDCPECGVSLSPVQSTEIPDED
jgi:hypothetical protein